MYGDYLIPEAASSIEATASASTEGSAAPADFLAGPGNAWRAAGTDRHVMNRLLKVNANLSRKWAED